MTVLGLVEDICALGTFRSKRFYVALKCKRPVLSPFLNNARCVYPGSPAEEIFETV